MKYWLNIGFVDTDQLVRVARAAEQAGYEGVALPDHLFLPAQLNSDYPYSADGDVVWPPDAPWPDCWVAIGAIAQATERLRFTTGVFIAPLRDVFSLAKSIGTAAGFAAGRVSCGFGAGWMREEFDIVGQDFTTRGTRLDEMLEVIQLLWSGEAVEFHGTQVDFPPVRMRPPIGPVPILIGGNTKPALRRAAHNDGWIGSHTDLDHVGRLMGELADQRDRAGRSGPFEVLLTATPRIAKESAALEALGVDGLIVPAVALGSSSAAGDIIGGLERFAERWLP